MILDDFVLWHWKKTPRLHLMSSVGALEKNKELEVASGETGHDLTDHFGQPNFRICLASVQSTNRMALCTVVRQ